jgi:sugar phosphate isomerase/epimerase
MKVGLRIPGACSKLPLSELAAWCKSDGFGSMDLGSPDAERVKTVQDAGLEIGTIDLPGTQNLLSSDESVRKEGIETACSALNAMKSVGVTKAFCVFFPREAQSRKTSLENWSLAFPTVAQEAEKCGVRIGVEGWPGPNNSALGVTPETLRLMFERVPSDYFGINFDPSHLIRVGVNYKRFLTEFATKVIHAHGKDTALDTEGAYLYGTLEPTCDPVVFCGGGHWRYTIPGEGVTDWAFVMDRLARVGFDGVIAIELEDFRYTSTVENEKMGLSRAKNHLLQYTR